VLTPEEATRIRHLGLDARPGPWQAPKLPAEVVGDNGLLLPLTWDRPLTPSGPPRSSTREDPRLAQHKPTAASISVSEPVRETGGEEALPVGAVGHSKWKPRRRTEAAVLRFIRKEGRALRAELTPARVGVSKRSINRALVHLQVHGALVSTGS